VVTRVSDPPRWPERLRLADDLWIIVHSDRTVRLNEVALGLALAGALLGELALSGHIAVRDGNVSVTDETPPTDAACHAILEQILAESPRHHVRVWVKFLAASAEQTVIARLLRARLVERVQQRRRLVRTTVVHRPGDRSQAYWRSVRLKRALAGRYGPTRWDDMFLAGLVDATGFLPAVLQEDHVAGHTYLAQWLPRADPPSLHELAAAVATLVGDAVLGARLQP
jgi:hypothetical protein